MWRGKAIHSIIDVSRVYTPPLPIYMNLTAWRTLQTPLSPPTFPLTHNPQAFHPCHVREQLGAAKCEKPKRGG